MSEGTSESTSKGPREEYLLYVRVPEQFNEPGSLNDFLERLANLLSDEAEAIYVEPYTRDEISEETRAPRDTHGRESGIKQSGEDCHGNSVAGSNKDSLLPMYFCHNKF